MIVVSADLIVRLGLEHWRSGRPIVVTSVKLRELAHQLLHTLGRILWCGGPGLVVGEGDWGGQRRGWLAAAVVFSVVGWLGFSRCRNLLGRCRWVWDMLRRRWRQLLSLVSHHAAAVVTVAGLLLARVGLLLLLLSLLWWCWSLAWHDWTRLSLSSWWRWRRLGGDSSVHCLLRVLIEGLNCSLNMTLVITLSHVISTLCL